MTETALAPTTVIRRYTFKLYPNSGQAAALDEQRRMCGQLWNALLCQQERWYLLGELLPLAEFIHHQRMRAGQVDQHVVDWRKGRWAEEDGEKVYLPGGEREWRKARIAEAKAAKRKRLSAFDQGKEITKLRHACPEFQKLPADTEARVADMLSEAFKGFFRRAKAGEKAGYPRFKSPDRFETIPFREMGRGWKLKVADGLCESGSKERTAFKLSDLPAVPCGDPEFEGLPQVLERKSPRADPCGDPEFEGLPQGCTEQPPHSATCGDAEFEARPHGGSAPIGRPSKWLLYVKGVTGLVKARGQLPRAPISWKNAEIIRRNGYWWLSLVVGLSATRKPGSGDLKVVFNLVDEFARVERVGGAMSAPRESANSSANQEDSQTSGADDLDLRAGDRNFVRISRGGPGADDLGLQRGFRRLAEVEQKIDALKAEKDLRFRRFSYRSRAASRRIAKMSSYAARYRSNLLHGWTTSLVAGAASLHVTAPAVKESTATARGNERRHGAAVRTVAELNRHVLNQAPGSAIQMLSYKAAEAAIPFALHKDENPVVSVGHDISTATKAARKARRIIKKATAA